MVHIVTGRILNYFVALLACSILFKSSSLHFLLLVKIDPRYLEFVVSFTRQVNFCSDILYVTTYLHVLLQE